MFPVQRWKYYALFHWAVCIQDERFLCMSLLVYHLLVRFTSSGIQKTSTALFWRMFYCPDFWCGVPIIWGSSSSSGCPVVHVPLFPVVSLKGSNLPWTFFSYWICICLLQVDEGYKYKEYHIHTPLFLHWSWQVCIVVYFKYLKGLSLNKSEKLMHFTAYFKVIQESSSARLFKLMNIFMAFHFRLSWVKAGFF